MRKVFLWEANPYGNERTVQTVLLRYLDDEVGRPCILMHSPIYLLFQYLMPAVVRMPYIFTQGDNHREATSNLKTPESTDLPGNSTLR